MMASLDLPPLPEGWVWTTLEEISEINPKFDGDDILEDIEVTFIPMRCVTELAGHIDLSLIRKLSEVRKGYTPFMDGDLLFAKITPSSGTHLKRFLIYFHFMKHFIRDALNSALQKLVFPWLTPHPTKTSGEVGYFQVNISNADLYGMYKRNQLFIFLNLI